MTRYALATGFLKIIINKILNNWENENRKF